MRPAQDPLSSTGDVGASPAPQHPSKVPALTLGWIFLHIGATAFDGLGTTLALIERELGQA